MQLEENHRPTDRTVAENCARTASYVFESVSRSARLSSLATPEMQDMFGEWVDMIGRQIISNIEIPGKIDVNAMAEEIGISTSTLLGLLLFLNRSGKISITEVGLENGCGSVDDICNCMKGK
jgi:hypothetical protein